MRGFQILANERKIPTNHQIILYDNKYRNGTTQYKILSSKNKFESYFHHLYSEAMYLAISSEKYLAISSEKI